MNWIGIINGLNTAELNFIYQAWALILSREPIVPILGLVCGILPLVVIPAIVDVLVNHEHIGVIEAVLRTLERQDVDDVITVEDGTHEVLHLR